MAMSNVGLNGVAESSHPLDRVNPTCSNRLYSCVFCLIGANVVQSFDESILEKVVVAIGRRD